MSKKVYEIITERILEQLDKGIIPWEKPWTGQGKCISRSTGKAYSFLNEMLLDRQGEYATFKQIQKEGGRVKKGAKSYVVTFWKMLPIEEENAKGEKVKKTIPLLRYYNVFNLEDCENIEPKHLDKLKDNDFKSDKDSEETISDYFNRHGINFENVAGNRAYYSPSQDKVVVPLKKQFDKQSEYYSTLFHEAIHSTGHESRLDRLTKTASFGSNEYSKEELVAEIGASTLVNMFGLETSSSFRNNTAYIQSWANALKNDINMIVHASSRAGKAVDMILDNK